MREEDVLAREASEVTAAQYPDRLRLGDLHLSLSYQFRPGTARDGVTVRVPAPAAAAIAGRTHRLAGARPALRQGGGVGAQPAEGDPQELRAGTGLQSAPPCERITFGEGSLPAGAGPRASAHDRRAGSRRGLGRGGDAVDDHLRMNIEVVDAQGQVPRRGPRPGRTHRAFRRSQPGGAGDTPGRARNSSVRWRPRPSPASPRRPSGRSPDCR